MDNVTWPSGANAPQRLPANAWLAAPLVWRSPLWPAVAVVVLALGLLSAFHQVVVGAVQQAETRRAAATAHADATWRRTAASDASRGRAVLSSRFCASCPAGCVEPARTDPDGRSFLEVGLGQCALPKRPAQAQPLQCLPSGGSPQCRRPSPLASSKVLP